MFKGYDLGSLQGSVNFETLAKNGISFVILRGYVGNDYFDPNFTKNLAAAKAAGLQVGVYNFCYILPTDNQHANRDPVSQAQLHYKHCGSGITTFADIEWPAPADFKKYGINATFVQNWVLAYLQEYEKLAGSVCIYTYPDFAKEANFASNPTFAKYPLWMANYQPNPVPFAPWNSSVVIQTGEETMVGHTSKVDVDQATDLSIFQIASPTAPIDIYTPPTPTTVPVNIYTPQTPPTPVSVPPITPQPTATTSPWQVRAFIYLWNLLKSKFG